MPLQSDKLLALRHSVKSLAVDCNIRRQIKSEMKNWPLFIVKRNISIFFSDSICLHQQNRLHASILLGLT